MAAEQNAGQIVLSRRDLLVRARGAAVVAGKVAIAGTAIEAIAACIFTLPTSEPTIKPTLTPEPTLTSTPEVTPSPIISPVPTESPRTELRLRPGEVVQHGDLSKPDIFFTVDDGWKKDKVIKILDLVKKYGVKITIFAVGDNVRAFPEIWKRAYEEGHSMQNHSMTHPENIDKMSEDEIHQQITDQLAAVREAIGNPDYVQHSFRPPYGVGAPPWYSLSPRLEKVCKDLGLAITTWTALSPGWDNKHTSSQVEKALGKYVDNGSILVLHDESKNDADITALEDLIRKAQGEGLKAQTLDVLFT